MAANSTHHEPLIGPAPGVLRRTIDTARVAIAVCACLLIATSLGMLGKFLLDPNGSEEFTVSRRPTLFHQVFDNEDRMFLNETYVEVIGAAHNSGGRIEATLQAITFGADVIEVDVVQVDGALYSGHTPPIPVIGPRFFRGPPLEEVWTAAYRADALKLDLKETSTEYVALVTEFLVTRPIDRDIIVASRSPTVLATLRQHAPDMTLLLSVPDESSFGALQRSEALQQTIDGVTVRESLIDGLMVAWLDEHDLSIFAWTVNDMERVNELVGLGVDGITTENLAILALLGGQAVSDVDLAGSTPIATDDESDRPADEERGEERPSEAHLDAQVYQADLDEHEVVGNEERQ